VREGERRRKKAKDDERESASLSGPPHLREVVQELDAWVLAQQDAVVDLVCDEVGGNQMVDVSCLAAVGSELEGAQVAGGTQLWVGEGGRGWEIN
jgi:hypothetical protein